MAFDKSLYKLKYYHTQTDRDGRMVWLEVWIRDAHQYIYYQMCELSGLQLEIQGAHGDVDAAIVKTSLRFSLIDCPDKVTNLSEKHGDWQEFYTPDSTKYLVLLKTMEPGATTYVTRWSGYITPDSWQESLDYHGEVTITARDNIGHLADFAFDAEGNSNGLISVFDIVESALAKVECPMELVWDAIDLAGQGYKTVTDADGKRLREMLLNVEAFEGQSWYDVLETVLGDLGMCLRYIDNNRIICTAVANLHLLGAGDGQDSPRRTPVFLGGTLTLNPPYRKMIDRLSYDYQKEIDYNVRAGLIFTEETKRVTSVVNNISGSPVGPIKETATVPIIQDNDGIGWQKSGNYYDLAGYEQLVTSNSERWKVDIADTDIQKGCAIVCAYDVENRYCFGDIRNKGVIHLECSEQVHLIDAYNKRIGARLGQIDRLVYSIEYEIGDIVYYWDSDNKRWTTELRSTLVQSQTVSTIDADFSASELPGTDGKLYLNIRAVVFNAGVIESLPSDNGAAFVIKSLSLEAAFDGLKNYEITTAPDENQKYNLINEKSCNIGAIFQEVERLNCRSYKNALWKDATTPAAWQWKLTEGTLMPLPSLIHLQRFMLHGVTKQILEGDAVVADGKGFDFNALYDYRGKVYIITSGTLDLIRGEMSVTLYEL